MKKLRKSKRGKAKPFYSISQLIKDVEMCYAITDKEMYNSILESIADKYERWTKILYKKSTKEYNLLDIAIKATVAEADKYLSKGEKDKAKFLINISIYGNDKGKTADDYIDKWIK